MAQKNPSNYVCYLVLTTILFCLHTMPQIAAGQASEPRTTNAGTMPVSRFAYVANQHANTISAFSIDSVTGSPKGGSSIPRAGILRM